jgi:diguanylate cyclase (GGDEF)-like protein
MRPKNGQKKKRKGHAVQQNIINADKEKEREDRLEERPEGLISSVSRLASLKRKTSIGDNFSDLSHPQAAKAAITAAREAEQQIADLLLHVGHLEHLATTDELTGALNRRGFMAQLKSALSATKRYDEFGVLAFIDLDGFKLVNDTFGHSAGDAVLKNIANLLRDHVRESDHVGRMGGDEFCILLTRTYWQEGIVRVRELDRLVNSTQINWHGQTIATKASLGFQIYGSNDTEEKLLNRVDAAMYRHKHERTSLNTICGYS